MRLVFASLIALALAVPATLAQQQDADRRVEGGGIKVEGWMGKIDARAASQGGSLNDSLFEMQGDDLHLKIGPAASYWNPANTATGDYTVGATFRELAYGESHPHPYGIFIAGRNMGSDEQDVTYCVTYGNGEVLVRRLAGNQATDVMNRAAHAAVNKAEGTTVTQQIAWRVSGGSATCVVNGQDVATIGAEQIGSTDGVFGIRISHNVEVMVSGFGKR